MEEEETNQEVEYYIKKNLKESLDKIKERIHKKDMDSVYCIDGGEGDGKSLFAMQVGKYLDSSLDLSRICMNPEEFKRAIISSKKGQVVIYDEAYRGLSSRRSLSEINKTLVSMMMEMRQKNLIVFIIIPTIFMLDKYVSLFRSRALFHIYMVRGRRGYWKGYNRKNKKKLVLMGQKTMSYSRPRIYDYKGRFYGKYPLDEEAYRQKKREALEKSEEISVDVHYKDQRDRLIYIYTKNMRKHRKLSFRQLEREFKEGGFVMSYAQLSEIYKKGGGK